MMQVFYGLKCGRPNLHIINIQRIFLSFFMLATIILTLTRASLNLCDSFADDRCYML